MSDSFVALSDVTQSLNLETLRFLRIIDDMMDPYTSNRLFLTVDLKFFRNMNSLFDC